MSLKNILFAFFLLLLLLKYLTGFAKDYAKYLLEKNGKNNNLRQSLVVQLTYKFNSK